MTDIPGMSWSMVHALASNGVRYFSNGPNYVEGMADMGDRIGYTLKALGDKPFWWKSSSGKDSILFWTAGKGYSSWHGTAPGGVFDRGPKKIANYMTELDAKGYPYSIVQWRYNIVADNGPVDSAISDFVKQWNEKYISPKLILSNVADVFKALEAKYGKSIPVLSGDFTPYWEDGAYSTAREEAENRLLSEKILQLENIAKQQNKTINAHWLYEAKRDVVMFHEHTWGAYNSISEPEAPFVIHQWNYKKGFVDSAKIYTDKIEAALFQAIDKPSTINVYNSLNWRRTGYVETEWPAGLTGNTLIDEKGELIPVQKLDNGHLAFVAFNVPAGGKRAYRFGPMVKKMPPPIVTFTLFDNNAKTGAISDLNTLDKHWVDTSIYKGLAQAIYVKGLNPANYFVTKVTKVEPIENGPVVNRTRITCSLEGTNGVVYEISQFVNLDYLNIAVTIDKKAIRDKEAIHIAFPFNIDNAEVKIGVDKSFITPEKGQISGSNKDFYSVQRWLDVSGKDYGVTMSSPEGALFEVGNMIDEREVNNGTKLWKTENHSSATVFLYALNNYWHTNYKATQDGKVTFNFTLQFHNKFDLKSAQKLGTEATEPLLVYAQ